MKSCFIIGGSVLVAGIVGVVLLVVFVFGATGPVVEAADDLMAKLGAGNVSGAYEATATALREENSLEEFAGFVEATGLVGLRAPKWESRGFDNNLGYVEGTVETASGTVRLRLETIKEDGQHRVVLLKKLPTAGGSGGAGEGAGGGEAVAMPSEDEVAALVEGTMVLLNGCIVSEDFGALYEASSSSTRQLYTKEQFAGAFAGLVDAKVRTDVRGLTPVYAEGSPSLGGDGRLSVDGHYQSGTVRLDFGLAYVREDDGWAPERISVDLVNE